MTTRHSVGWLTAARDVARGGRVASLRLDLPGARDERRQAGGPDAVRVLNALGADTARPSTLTGLPRVGVVGASLPGGVAACFAARRPEPADRLVLFYPLLDHRQRFGDRAAPTMPVHGSADPAIPLASSEKAAADLIVPHELAVLDGAGHGFSPAAGSAEAVADSREWTAAVAAATRWLTPPRP